LLTAIEKPVSIDASALAAQSRANKERLIAAIDGVADQLEAQTEENHRLGHLNATTLDLLRELEIPKLMGSPQYGGLGMFPGDAIRVIDRLAQIDGSIGWIAGNWSSGGLLLAYLPDNAVRTILAEDPSPYFCAASTPSGKAIPVDGGYRVTGRWQYGSGSAQAAYLFLVAVKHDAEGKPIMLPHGMPATATFVTSARYLETHGNWDAIGLLATASVDYSVTDAFVPHDFVIEDMFGPPPSNEINLRITFQVVLQYLHGSYALGSARLVLDSIGKYAHKPAPRGPSQAEQQPFRIEYAKQEAQVQAARALTFEGWDAIDRALQSGRDISRREFTTIRLALLNMHTVLREAATFAFNRGGGTSLRAGKLQRVVFDALAGCQHILASENFYSDVAWELLGAPPEMQWGPVCLIPSGAH